MNRLTQRIKDEIIEDVKQHDKEDGHFSLSDRYLKDVDYTEYKNAVHSLNDDKEFPYIVNITLINGTVKMRYSPYGSKTFEKIDTRQALEYIDEIRSVIERIQSERDAANIAYFKRKDTGDGEQSHIIIESLDGQKWLEVRMDNEF